jgi:hypothetical protein
MKRIIYYLSNRFILAVVFIILFFIVNYIYTSNILPSTNTRDTWFYSGLLLLLFSIIFVEPFYTSPKNIITNTIPLLISYVAIKSDFKDNSLWHFTFWFVFACFITALICLALQNQNESSESKINKFAERIRVIVSVVATGKVIYSLVFISIIFLYKSDLQNEFSEGYFFVMIILWALVLAIDPKSLHSKFKMEFNKKDNNQIGSVFSIQSNNMYLIKLFEDKNDIQKFDLVRFKESSENKNNVINQGFVFDTYKLNSEKWAKVLCLDSCVDSDYKYTTNIVYKVQNELKIDNEEVDINSFVGVVVERSKIGIVKFEYSKKINDVQEGVLLELQTQGKKVFYQIVGGLTEHEKLENKNESGFIVGEAIQLGVWNNESMSFEKFGWIPDINTPIFVAKTDGIPVEEVELPEFKLGIIPNTKLPSIINLNEAVSHHTAFLGITGSGKSFLTREIIKGLTDLGIKVICVDFTGEWKKSMDLMSLNSENLNDFFKPECKDVGVVELPTISNTVKVIQSTETFISTIFNRAKEEYEKDTPIKICLILEEAHTIIPEVNFLGVNDFESKAVVNKIGQVALQGRKYGVGLFVIAQRTANVSKTVLTQCNTIVCFQAFDETSFNFLGNYIGKDLVQALPNLKRYHAIVTGKAIKSNIPMIIDLERKSE